MIRRALERWPAAACALAMVVALGACQTGSAPTPEPTSAPTPTAALTPVPSEPGLEEVGAAWCASLDAMTRAIGNPDTAMDSELSAAFEQAIDTGDLARADELADAMQAELQTARDHAAVVAGLEATRDVGAGFDDVLAAFQIKVEATRAAADQGLQAADRTGQAAFEHAGALATWDAWRAALSALPPGARDTLLACGER